MMIKARLLAAVVAIAALACAALVMPASASDELDLNIPGLRVERTADKARFAAKGAFRVQRPDLSGPREMGGAINMREMVAVAAGKDHVYRLTLTDEAIAAAQGVDTGPGGGSDPAGEHHEALSSNTAATHHRKPDGGGGGDAMQPEVLLEVVSPPGVFGEGFTWQQVADTRPLPNSAVAQIYPQKDDDIASCTAFFISPTVMATAAHCIYNYKTKTWANVNMFVALARNDGSTHSWPYAIPKGVRPYVLSVPHSFMNGPHGSRFDFGVIVFRRPVQVQVVKTGKFVPVPHLGITRSHARRDKSLVCDMISYPGDNSNRDGQQWIDRGPVYLIDNDDYPFYARTRMDVVTSCSGAPIIQQGTKLVEGIMVATELNRAQDDERNSNILIRFNNEVYNWLLVARNRPFSSYYRKKNNNTPTNRQPHV